jgi:acyl carrier protein/carbonic anhydrase/acetyltransferase-like protein (isoleucine patch superfamily)
VRAVDALRTRVALAGATRVGADVRVLGWPSIASDGELIVERGVVLVASPSPIELLVASGARLVIGEGSVLESGATLRAQRQVVVGRGVRIGAGCVIDDEGSDAGGIEIGDDAWLEDGALVLGGARVAARARMTRGAALDARRAIPIDRAADAADRSPQSADDAHVRQIVARVLPGALGVSSDTDLRCIAGWDSLAALRVLIALEKEFRVNLPHDLFATARTLQSVVPLLAAHRDAP